jgi:hypothetical protein
MTGYTEREYDSQQEVLDLTEGVAIRKILTDTWYDVYDVAWELEDGRIVAFTVGRGGGCETCGYGADENHWYILTPKAS